MIHANTHPSTHLPLKSPSEPPTTSQPMMERKWRMTESVDGHQWGFWKADKFECCRICGIVRRADKKNKPCNGKPKLRL